MVAINNRMWQFINDAMLIICFNLFISYGMGEIMASQQIYYNQDIAKKAANLASVASETDNLFKTMGYGPAGDYLTNIMGQESLYGHIYDKDASHTMTMAQIDPVRYWELLNDMDNYSGWSQRGDKINKHMQSQTGYEDWDIRNMAQVDVQPKNISPYASGSMTGPYAVDQQNFDFNYAPGSISPHTQDPKTAFMLSRLMLTKDTQNAIPVTPQAQAEHWDSFWNRNPAPGTGVKEFLSKLPYRESGNLLDNYNQKQSGFKYE